MKNPSMLCLAVLVPLLLSSCGRPSAAPSAPPQDTDSALDPKSPVPLPAGAGPAGLPPCPGFLAVESSQGDEQAGTSVLLSSQTPVRLLDFYATHLATDGWVMETTLRQKGEMHLHFRQADRFLRLQIGPGAKPGATARLQFAWGRTAGLEEVREAYAPEFEEDEPDVNQGSMEW